MDYGQLTDYLKSVANGHVNVVYSEAGYIEDINWGENNYPMVMFVCQPGTFQPNRINYNMTMIVADIMDDNVRQQITKQSNMYNIGKDIITYIITTNQVANPPLNLVEESVVFTPFTDHLPDLCTGFQFDFQIYVENRNDCDIPISLTAAPVPPPPPPIECLPEYGAAFSINAAQFDNVLDPAVAGGGIWRFGSNVISDPSIGVWNNDTFTPTVLGTFEFIIETTVQFNGPPSYPVPSAPQLLFNYVVYSDDNCNNESWPTAWTSNTITYTSRYAINLQSIGPVQIISSFPVNSGSAKHLVGGTLKIGYTP